MLMAMTRRASPALTWLLLCLLALLLPLRGLAHGLMGGQPAGGPVMAQMVMAQVPADSAAAPCHPVAADEDAATPATGTGHHCAACDLCHAALALAQAPRLALATARPAAPPATTWPAPPAGRSASIFRPPRA